jgi:hypothetical protein
MSRGTVIRGDIVSVGEAERFRAISDWSDSS